MLHQPAPDPASDPMPVARRLAGVASLIGSLINLGLIRLSSSPSHRLETFAAADGQRIPLRAAGSAPPPIVLVHGLGCSHRSWWPVARRLATRHRVLAWDARGHGACRVERGASITLTQLGSDLAALLDHLGVPRAVLVGHSMGALTVMQYMSDFGTGRVAAACLVDQSPRIVTDDEWRLGLFGGCSAPMLEALIEGARRDLTDTVLHQIDAGTNAWLKRRMAPDAFMGRRLREWLKGIDAAPLLDLAQSLAKADFRQSLARLDSPLMVVLGAASPHYGQVPLADWYRRHVPHANISTYERAGHSPHYTEPMRFARDLEQFLADHA
ncbi:MAG: alpha/beta hydrolase [Burkholderiales bacterium]